MRVQNTESDYESISVLGEIILKFEMNRTYELHKIDPVSLIRSIITRIMHRFRLKSLMHIEIFY